MGARSRELVLSQELSLPACLAPGHGSRGHAVTRQSPALREPAAGVPEAGRSATSCHWASDTCAKGPALQLRGPGALFWSRSPSDQQRLEQLKDGKGFLSGRHSDRKAWSAAGTADSGARLGAWGGTAAEPQGRASQEVHYHTRAAQGRGCQTPVAQGTPLTQDVWNRTKVMRPAGHTLDNVKVPQTPRRLPALHTPGLWPQSPTCEARRSALLPGPVTSSPTAR